MSFQGGKNVEVAGFSDGLGTIWDEEQYYSDDAQGKYLHILDSISQFHDQTRGESRTFSFVIV